MFDEITEKLLKSTTALYMPKLEELAKVRASELAIVKDKVRTSPEEVESWFDGEIRRVTNVDAKDLIEKIKKVKTRSHKATLNILSFYSLLSSS
jgi:hypothetical protein